MPWYSHAACMYHVYEYEYVCMCVRVVNLLKSRYGVALDDGCQNAGGILTNIGNLEGRSSKVQYQVSWVSQLG